MKEIKVKAGDKVKVGQAILSVEDGAGAAAPAADEGAPKRERGSAPKAAATKGDAAKPETAPKHTVAKGEPAKAEAAPKEPEPATAGDETPDMQPDVRQARDKSTTPDKEGVKDPGVGPQTEEQDDDEAPPGFARDWGRDDGSPAPQSDRKVVDINRGASRGADARSRP